MQRKNKLCTGKIFYEANRLYGVLDNKLKDQEWITGEYSIADIAVYPWTMTPDRQGVELSHFDNVIRWKEQMKKDLQLLKVCLLDRK